MAARAAAPLGCRVDLMTERLAQESVNKYSGVLGYEYRGGRSATTAKLHQVESRKVEFFQKERLEAQQWHCVFFCNFDTVSYVGKPHIQSLIRL